MERSPCDGRSCQIDLYLWRQGCRRESRGLCLPVCYVLIGTWDLLVVAKMNGRYGHSPHPSEVISPASSRAAAGGGIRSKTGLILHWTRLRIRRPRMDAGMRVTTFMRRKFPILGHGAATLFEACCPSFSPWAFNPRPGTRDVVPSTLTRPVPDDADSIQVKRYQVSRLLLPRLRGNGC